MKLTFSRLSSSASLPLLSPLLFVKATKTPSNAVVRYSDVARAAHLRAWRRAPRGPDLDEDLALLWCRPGLVIKHLQPPVDQLCDAHRSARDGASIKGERERRAKGRGIGEERESERESEREWEIGSTRLVEVMMCTRKGTTSQQ